MKRKHRVGLNILRAVLFAVIFLFAVWMMAGHKGAPTTTEEGPDGIKMSARYAGSRNCIECHEKFYRLWSTSRHGLSFQPYSPEFAKASLSPQQNDIAIGKYIYRADISGPAGRVVEKGPEGERNYRIEQVIGGKYVYYFLTKLERGKLQTLPVAYDVSRKEWFDTAASGIRHFPAGQRPDSAVFWKERPYTFNTACFGCHVSQMRTNYDIERDAYRTDWREPGINCETCHGPSGEHSGAMAGFKSEKAPPGMGTPKDMKIISAGKFTVRQHNDSCNSCHSKSVVLTRNFQPGDRFFDHYDLVTLEDLDFYPDGRDLGENYTHTTWLMSPCAQSGKLSCIHCHTSSGRYRFKAEDKANNACLPCHEERVASAAVHTRHLPGSPAGQCIACHMPRTEFARMKRSDHSLLPPAPAATLAYKSPNACNNCHTDKDAGWADKTVRKWRKRDYQAPVLQRAALIDGARKRDWSRLPEMLRFLEQRRDRDEVAANSLVRLLRTCVDPRKNRVMLKLMSDRSPLIRASAADAAALNPARENLQALVKAAGDEYRLVRIRAAAGLAGKTGTAMAEADRKNVGQATREYVQSLAIPPDHWAAYYNKGNYYLNLGDYRQAIAGYETSLRLEPRSVLSLVNMSIANARLGENKRAESSLQEALKIAPESAAANFNMGLLRAEQGDRSSAQRHLREAWRTDPSMGEAAYNLCVLIAESNAGEAIGWCRKAHEARPSNPRYAYSLAYYERQTGDMEGAVRTLKALIRHNPDYPDAYAMLGETHERQGRLNAARAVYRQALRNPDLPAQSRTFFELKLREISER